MLAAAELRERAAEYRATAMKQSDARTRAQYLAVAEYLDDWAMQTEVEDAGFRAALHGRRAV